jgi:O-antigen ligase
LACVMVIVGMYLSRALMSIGMMLLIMNAVMNIHFKDYWKYFIRHPYLVCLSLYFLYAAVSGLWSENTGYLFQRLQILLPFLTLPLAFISIGKWESKWVHWILAIFILLNIGGIVWSLSLYFPNKAFYDAGYHYSHQIPTPFKQDHIRFSLSVVMSILFCVSFWNSYPQTRVRILMLGIVVLDIFYLHILSVKSGLIAFYLISFLYIIRFLFIAQYRKYGVLLMAILIMLPILMYQISESFRTKIGYVRYSLERMQNEMKETNISDEGRLISYQFALEIIRTKPLSGVGYGDVFDAMQKKYDAEFGQGKTMPLIPHNQILMAGVAMGIPGIILLLTMFILLWKQVRKQDFLFFCFMVLMSFAISIEAFFETQYGMCLFLFFLLLLLQRKKNPPYLEALQG